MFLRGLWAVGVLLFALAVAVQYNDPDPFIWGVIYGVVAAMNLAALLRRLPPRLAGLLLVPYVAGALPGIPRLLTASRQMFATIGMQNVEQEQVREAGGAVICALWVLGLWLYARRHPPADENRPADRAPPPA